MIRDGVFQEDRQSTHQLHKERVWYYEQGGQYFDFTQKHMKMIAFYINMVENLTQS